MKKKVKILMVDDHPLIVEAYKDILLSAFDSIYDFIVELAHDCDSAIARIEKSASKDHYDLFFFDISLPASSDKTIISGEDLAIFAKKKMPNAKVIILTMFSENHRIHHILKMVNPDGLLIKSDLTTEEFQIAFKSILKDPPYYSKTVSKFFRKQSFLLNHDLLDDVNRKIVYFISKGIKTKDLTNYVNLSLSAIEKRKSQIKLLLGIEKSNDEDLIREAKSRGLI